MKSKFDKFWQKITINVFGYKYKKEIVHKKRYYFFLFLGLLFYFLFIGTLLLNASVKSTVKNCIEETPDLNESFYNFVDQLEEDQAEYFDCVINRGVFKYLKED